MPMGFELLFPINFKASIQFLREIASESMHQNIMSPEQLCQIHILSFSIILFVVVVDVVVTYRPLMR